MKLTKEQKEIRQLKKERDRSDKKAKREKIKLEKLKQKNQDKKKKIKKGSIEAYYIRQARMARTIWYQSSVEKKECLKIAMKSVQEGIKKYECHLCKNSFSRSEVEVDHIQPVGNKPENIDEYLFYFHALNTPNLQVLCKHKCHRKKTHKDIIMMKEKT